MPESHDCYDSMMGWIDKIGSVPTDELSEALHECYRDYDRPEYDRLPFSHRVRAAKTEWPVSVPRNVPPKGFEPRSIHDILRPWAYEDRKRWYKELLSDLRRMVIDPENYERRLNRTLVLGESAFWPDAYGTRWDFSVRINGVIQPAGFRDGE